MKRTPAQVNIYDYPEALREYLRGAAVFDSSCSKEAKVLYIDEDGGFFLKEAGAESLKTESLMTEYMHSLGLSAELLYYGFHGGIDYLLTRRIPGEDCTDARYLSDPKRLCVATAELLRKLHETDGTACPVQDKILRYAGSVRKGFDGCSYEPALFSGIWEFGSFEEARQTAEEGLKYLKGDTLLHGDYCLPNILLDDWKFSGFIDLGGGGMGDRHIDLLWGIWTLKYNLGTAEYTGRFMDAYGRDRIDEDMLRMTAAMEMIGE